MAKETKTAGAWISEVVAAATSRETYQDTHPGFDSDITEVVIYSLMRDQPLHTVNGIVVWRSQWWLVKGIISYNDTDAANDIAEQIYQALHRKFDQAPFFGGRVRQSIDVGPEVSYTERDSSNTIYRHAGSIYKMLVERI